MMKKKKMMNNSKKRQMTITRITMIIMMMQIILMLVIVMQMQTNLSPNLEELRRGQTGLLGLQAVPCNKSEVHLLHHNSSATLTEWFFQQGFVKLPASVWIADSNTIPQQCLTLGISDSILPPPRAPLSILRLPLTYSSTACYWCRTTTEHQANKLSKFSSLPVFRLQEPRSVTR